MARRLADAFLAAAEPAVATQLEDDDELESILTSHVAAAREAWPGLEMDEIRFVEHLAARTSADVDARKSVRATHAAELFLALACGRGERHAVVELEKLLALLPDALTRLASKAPVDEVLQLLRAKLLVAEPGGKPKILEYSGRGALAGWLRVAAVRTAISLGRKTDAAAEPVTREVLLAVPGVADDPETIHLRERYKGEFKLAFEQAVRSLAVEQRNVLKLSLIDGLSIDEIGALFHVHRATAARWIQRSLETVRERTREIVLERLRLSEAELASLMMLVRSGLELSIQRVLVDDRAGDQPARGPAPR